MRKTYEELNELKIKLNVSRLWSWSRYNNYINSKYEYYLNYVKKVKPDRSSIYSVQGGDCHDILEKFYRNEIKYEDMINEYNDNLARYEILGLKYDRSDDEKNEKIAKKYEDCMKHFFQNHNIINSKVELERFITVKVGKYVFQGYIDLLYYENGYFIVGDWKTSTIYTGEKIQKEQGQLLLYSESLIQRGIPIDKIKARWNFLKYVTVHQPQANGEIKLRNIERNQIGSKLKTNVKMWLKKADYNKEDIENYLDTMTLTNSIDCLPDEIKDKYIFEDCWVDINLTEDAIKELKTKISKTLTEIQIKEIETYKLTENEELTNDEKYDKIDNIWWDEVTDKESYYFSNLCGYSAHLHKPYKQYLEERSVFNSGGSGSVCNVSKGSDGEDYSWLDELE